MPLAVYPRGKFWWAKGRVEFEGLPITKYYRESTGSLTAQGAIEWTKAETDRQRRRYLLGEEAERLTIGGAIEIYDPKLPEAKRLIAIIKAKGDPFLSLAVDSITGKYLRDLGRELKPNAATDTMWREVVSPLRAVINNAHDLGKGPPIRVKRYSEKERIDQDVQRGKQSRIERKPGSRDWIEAFCAQADIYNAAMARFMFETAARIDQTISLVPDDLNLQNKQVRLKAAKGHPEQWVQISHPMMIELANLPPKRPLNRKHGYLLEARVFGYGSPTGYTKRWQTICKRAGIPYLSAHAAGRHGFYTELRVRQGVDPITAAKAGRWKDPTLPDRIYAHPEANEAELRERIRTGGVQSDSSETSNPLKKRRKFND